MDKHLIIITKADQEMLDLAKKHLGGHVMFVSEVIDLDFERFEQMIDTVNEASNFKKL